MLLGAVFDRFVAESPVSVMVRGALEYALAPSPLDTLFARVAERQYTQHLLFSSLVDLVGVVAVKARPSVNKAFLAVKPRLPVSITSVYNKLNGVEPDVCAALVAHVGARLGPVVRAMGGTRTDPLPGFRLKILDGNHPAATQRRLAALRGSAAGPLPGVTLVVLDPVRQLAIATIPYADGHAQERAQTDAILALVQPGDAWLDDRNFCTTRLVFGTAARHACFLTRQHASNVAWRARGPRRKVGRIEGGTVYEQRVVLLGEAKKTLRARRITVVLDHPTRDGDTEVHILTNLPRRAADAKKIAEIYRTRWTLETMFQHLEASFASEIETLGYPGAALFSFAVAVCAYNILSVVQAALRATHGPALIAKPLSADYLASEVAAVHQGLMIAIPPVEWQVFRDLSPDACGARLQDLAVHIRLAAFQQRGRGPKKPVPPRTRYRDKPHVSTARLLAGIPP